VINQSRIASRPLNSELALRIHGSSLWKVEGKLPIRMSLPLFGLLGKKVPEGASRDVHSRSKPWNAYDDKMWSKIRKTFMTR
jgi:hypothetical protein